MTRLITGGTGYIGAELAHLLVERGENIVLFDIAINEYRVEDILKKVKIVRGDVSNWSEVMNVVKDNKITEIYHLGSMLTYVSELNPWGAFRANVVGTYNVLEAARIFGVNKIMFTSTMGTYSLLAPEVIDDETIQRPTTVYGVGKLYGEGLGRFYRSKFDVDFRAIRYPAMYGPNVRTPGHWGPPMVEDAISGRVNTCIYGIPESMMPVIYLTDAAAAAMGVLDAPKEKIKMVNYCVCGPAEAVVARDLENKLKQRFPKFKVNYAVDAAAAEVMKKSPIVRRFDDRFARQEWGWKPKYTTVESIIDQFAKDMKDHPKRFGLA